jgi:hypothetical protein
MFGITEKKPEEYLRYPQNEKSDVFGRPVFDHNDWLSRFNLIRDTINNLNQRVVSLESQNHHLIQRNQSLEGELNEIKYNINWNRQNLENRITDFTDMWHPLMTDNINRIKTSLEETVMAKENLDIIKIQTELDLKFTNIIKENCAEQLSDHTLMIDNINRIKKSLEETIMTKENLDIIKIQTEFDLKLTNIIKENCVEQLSDYILVGFKDNETLPVFIHKNSEFQAIFKFRNTDPVAAHRNAFGGAVLIAQNLKHIKNITTYDICSLQHLKITDKDSNIIYNPDEMSDGSIELFRSPIVKYLTPEQLGMKSNIKNLKKLLKVFDGMGIKLIMHDSEFINGVSIRTLIENI